MGLFEDMMVNAKSAFGTLGEKASKAVDVSKLKISEAEINKQISGKFENLGRAVYNASKNSNAASQEVISKAVSEVDDLYAKLKEVTDKIATAKNKIRCQQCGFENQENIIYCGGCGASLVNQKDAAEENQDTVLEKKDDVKQESDAK